MAGRKWTGTDISAEQINQAKRLSAQLDIAYETVAAENIKFPADKTEMINLTAQAVDYGIYIF